MPNTGFLSKFKILGSSQLKKKLLNSFISIYAITFNPIVDVEARWQLEKSFILAVCS